MKKLELKKGDRYGRLVIIKEIPNKNRRFFECFCDCGKSTVVPLNHLRDRHTVSCGCKKKEIKHGMCDTKTYEAWAGLIQRCTNPKSLRFYNYGGRGIKVCKEWMSFEKFYKDMGEAPIGMTIDRINNNGNYCKENCRWTTNKEQSRNKRSNRLISMNGKTQLVISWAEELGINANTIRTRLYKGWNPIKALKEPLRYT